MLIRKDSLKQLLLPVLAQRIAQGCDLDQASFSERIEAASDSYDALFELARELRSPPMRPDWPFREPVAWPDIVAECEHLDPGRSWPEPDFSTAASNVRAAFLGSVCGCMLGKPVEVDPTLAELEAAGTATGEWPLRNYISRAFVQRLGRAHESVASTTREKLRCAVADDDIHYTLIGMFMLESKGLRFDHDDAYRQWLSNMPPLWTWGPERTTLLTTGIHRHHLFSARRIEETHDVLLLNPGDEQCGALIRADAYGYACPGNPDLAAWLAWKDASFSHIKTGVYGSMFIAALIALCHTADNTLRGNDRLGLVEEALKRVPAQSRFAEIVRDSLARVARAPDWQQAYASIHGRYREYTHCAVFQEIGTLVNSLKFAESVDHGFCLQVSQGNDTDSFGATCGSILGCFYGEGHLDDRWLQPLNNRLQHALADFHLYDLSAIAERVACLPRLLHNDYSTGGLPDNLALPSAS